jgi:acyl carrier protein
MTFEEARDQILMAIHFAIGALDEKQVANILAARGGDVDLSDLGLDSIATMEMCLEIEEKTGIELDFGDLAQHFSVNALAKYMVARTTSNDR